MSALHFVAAEYAATTLKLCMRAQCIYQSNTPDFQPEFICDGLAIMNAPGVVVVVHYLDGTTLSQGPWSVVASPPAATCALFGKSTTNLDETAIGLIHQRRTLSLQHNINHGLCYTASRHIHALFINTLPPTFTLILIIFPSFDCR